jgi:hypothetical protein
MADAQQRVSTKNNMKKPLKRLLRPFIQGMIRDEVKHIFADENEDIRTRLSRLEGTVKELDEEVTNSFIRRTKEGINQANTD